jgi:DNA-binding MarR family transcriptional regulator
MNIITLQSMKLEEAIKQHKPFTSHPEKLFVNILYTSGWIENRNTQRLKPYGISPQQYNVLRILRGCYPQVCTLGSVASRMIDKNSNATRLVEKLRIKQLVKREISTINRRQVDISITQAGLDLLDNIEIDMQNWYKEIIPIPDNMIMVMNELLDAIRTGTNKS